MKKTLYFVVAALVLLVQPLSVFAEEISRGFNPNLLVPDSVFADTKTLGGPEGIQTFLQSKNSVLANTSTEFLLKLHEPDDAFLKQKLDDPSYNLGKPRTAAHLIWDAAQSSGLNPQVILVTLNKEQGLITGNHSPDRLQRALDHSMGFGCPDGGSCDAILSGFYFQLFGNVDNEGNRYLGAAKSLMRSYNVIEGKGPTYKGKISRVGETIILPNTLGGYSGVQPQQTITIGNRSTAALYRYTPHVFNGNYNFWKFFTTWFAYPNGTILKDTTTNVVYILQKGLRRELPLFVANSRKINVTKAVVASPVELAKYPLGELYGPLNNTVVSLDGKTFVFIDGIQHPASSVVLKQKRIASTKSVRITQAESARFPVGAVLMPKDGTVLRAVGDKKIYLVKNGGLKLFSVLTLKQYNARKKVQQIAAADLATYPKVGFVTPLNGTLLKTATGKSIYLMDDGQKRPVPQSLFSNRKYLRSEVSILDDATLASIPVGKFVTPRESTYFKIAKTTNLYFYKFGKVHLVDPKIAKKRHLRARYTFEPEYVKDWPVGEEIKK